MNRVRRRRGGEVMRIWMIYMACLLASCGAQGQSIDSLLLEQDDIKAMYNVLAQLEDKSDAEIDTYINEFMEVCTKREREHLKYQTVMRLYNASTPSKPTGELLAMMRSMGVLVGDKAPDFAIDGTTSLYDMLGEQTILFFYEHSCHFCHEEMKALKTRQEALEAKGVRIISIDCNAEQTTILPWQHNLADPVGAIYHRYGVMSTPTYFLIDKEGKIVGRYKKLSYVM